MREQFITTARIAFSHWSDNDIVLARSLWGDPDVTRYICASGVFTENDICARLQSETRCQEEHGVQYWPIFRISDGDLIGCCGLHPHGKGCYELGFHLRPGYWRQGYATEAARAAIDYAFEECGADSLFAGHNPNNTASGVVLKRLGFEYTGDEFYEPTGLMHPSYILRRFTP